MLSNARLFRLKDPAAFPVDGLEEALGTRRFRPCGPVEEQTLGWYPPLGERAVALAHRTGDWLILCARRQERLLPPAAVAETLDERVAELEEREARSVGRSERRRLRDEVLLEMLPRAFTRSRQICALLDLATGWVVVDAASEKLAEDVLSLLRETLGSLPVRPVVPGIPAEALMTRWVTEGAPPEGLILGEECELRDAADERVVVRCRGQDLGSEEIATHLGAGKQVVKLALDWKERLAFLLHADLSLKRLRFADALLEEAEVDDEDEVARFDAELVIMAQELRDLLGPLAEWFALEGEASA